MSFIKEFKEFAMKGNVVDMAVGIVIGAGFGKIVSSLVSDVLMPPLGLVIGGVNFSNLKITLKSAAESGPAVTLNYGIFLQTVFDFTIVALAMFTVVKIMNRIKRQPAEPPAPTLQEKLLGEIRDILRDAPRRAA